MKRKKVNLSMQEIDILTKESLHSIKGGISTKNSSQNSQTFPIKDEPWVKIGVSENF